MIELVGIIASVVVAIAFFVNGERHIREVNMIGSAIFVIYGLLISSISLVFLNTLSIFVNTIKLYKIYKGDIPNENNDNSNR